MDNVAICDANKSAAGTAQHATGRPLALQVLGFGVVNKTCGISGCNWARSAQLAPTDSLFYAKFQRTASKWTSKTPDNGILLNNRFVSLRKQNILRAAHQATTAHNIREASYEKF